MEVHIYTRMLRSKALTGKSNPKPNKCVGPPYCQAEMYAGRVACCPLVSHSEYGTDGLTDRRDRYTTLSPRRGQID